MPSRQDSHAPPRLPDRSSVPRETPSLPWPCREPLEPPNHVADLQPVLNSEIQFEPQAKQREQRRRYTPADVSRSCGWSRQVMLPSSQLERAGKVAKSPKTLEFQKYSAPIRRACNRLLSRGKTPLNLL